MAPEEIARLMTGDIIVNRGSGHSYVVLTEAGEAGDWPVAVRHITVTNPAEWEYVPRNER